MQTFYNDRPTKIYEQQTKQRRESFCKRSDFLPDVTRQLKGGAERGRSPRNVTRSPASAGSGKFGTYSETQQYEEEQPQGKKERGDMMPASNEMNELTKNLFNSSAGEQTSPLPNTNSTSICAEMPRYKSHKTVWALKIKEIIFDVDIANKENRKTDGSARITPEDGRYAPFTVDAEYVKKHKPQAGGYYVVYQDGYKSWSPAQAFEEGYTLV